MATVNILADIADTLTVLAAELKKVSAQGGFEKFAVETPFEEVKPEPVQAAPAEKKIGYDDLRKLCAGVSAAGKTAEIKAIITDAGAARLSELPEDKWAEVYEKAKALKGDA